MPTFLVGALGDARVPLFLTVPRTAFASEFPVRIRVESSRDHRTTTVSATFLGPAR
jgi:hypothetical protein